MSKEVEERAVALALDEAFLRDCSAVDDNGNDIKATASMSTPRLRLEAAQLLADRIGDDSNPPSEAYFMEEIFKDGSTSFNNLSSELDNKQTLDEMEKILENLQTWRDTRQAEETEDEDSSDEDEDEYAEQRKKYQQQQMSTNSEQPLSVRLANEKTIDSLASLVAEGQQQEQEEIDKASIAVPASESSMLFRRIEDETRVIDNSQRLAEEKVSSDGHALENDMSALEAQLRGFGSELDHHLLLLAPLTTTGDSSAVTSTSLPPPPEQKHGTNA